MSAAMHTYVIRYNSPERGTCFDSELAANQNAAYDSFKDRRPAATHICIKSRGGVWIQHYLENVA